MSVKSLIARYRRWRAIRNTKAELSRLPASELDDLGIARWQIDFIAREGACWKA